MTKTSCDVCIIGAGAAGSVIASYLSKKNLNVMMLDAGPHRDPQKDFASDELEMEKLFWDEPRISQGEHPIDLYRSTSGKGVGGSAVHYTAQLLRFHPSDFSNAWPLSYKEVKPYYEHMTKHLNLAGPSSFPWREFGERFPFPAHHDLSNNTLKFREGLEALGVKHAVSPLAILSAPHNERHPCINRGFCEEGCMPDSKTTPLNTFIPEALQNGTNLISEATAVKIDTDEQRKVKSIQYIKDEKLHEIDTSIVVVAAYAVETPRLLLQSQNEDFPNGLGNSSGVVGRYIMPNMNDHLIAKSPEEIRMYRGNPVQALTMDYYEKGYVLNSYGMRPVRLASLFFDNDQSCVGESLRRRMLDYNHFTSFAMLGEVQPQKENRVELSDQKDLNGMPIPKVTFSHHQHDLKIRKEAKETMENVARASGGEPLYHLEAHAHLMGGCRMGDNPKESVVNTYGQSHDIENLFIAGSPTFVSAPAANPTLTVYSLAQRSAEYIESYFKRVLA